MTSLLSAAMMTSVIGVIFSAVCLGGLLAASDVTSSCAPSCTCRRKNPTSSLTMNCSGVVEFPLSHLNIVNVSSAVSELDLSKNSLTSLSARSFHGFAGLQTLTVRWNLLAVVESDAFRGTQLRRLDLSANRLATVRPRTFTGVESTMLELDLSSNVIVSVDDAFFGLSALSRLDLRHNLLASLTTRSLRGLTSLRHLRLDNNLIAQIDPSSLFDLSKLINLALRGNPLSALTRLRFPDNASLSYLDLSECSLTAIPRGVPDTATYVQLRRNNITRLSGDGFRGAFRVKILVLDENRISDVDDRTFGHLRSLNQLWLNNNELVRVPAGLPSSVQRLMLDSNNIDRLVADSFANLSKLGTLTLMGNVIAEVAVGAFHPLSELTHLDLSANDVSSVSSGLFASNAKLDTLLLSRNPFRSLNAGIFDGLRQLRTLSMSFVQTRICVDEEVFEPLRQLVDLQLDSSPWLAESFVSQSRLVRALTSLRHLSLQRTDLGRLRSSFFSSLSSSVESVRLSGSGWLCDEELVWLRDWLMTSPLASDVDRQLNRCAEPLTLATRLVASLADHEFKQPSDHRHPQNYPRTGNSKLSRQNADTDCNEGSETTSAVAMVTGTPASALSSPNGLRRGREKTTTSSATSQLRHDDVTDDVGLVQVVLIVCTLVVTLALSAVIIGVIVRLSSRRRRDDQVTSGIQRHGQVTGSRVSVRNCPSEDTAIEVGRSRASSLSRGVRTTDYQRQVRGRTAVCTDANDRLVSKADVEHVFVNGGGTRLADEQWRLYTWEDT